MTASIGYAPITLLNASYEPLRSVDLKRAARLLVLGKAVVHESEAGRFLRDWPWPKVLRLVKYVRIAYDKLHGPRMWSKRGVLERDGHRCGYCRAMGAHTIDHVVPRAQGGASTWLNTVAACLPCNGRKRDRTPAQAGMKLLTTPYVPRVGRTA